MRAVSRKGAEFEGCIGLRTTQQTISRWTFSPLCSSLYSLVHAYAKPSRWIYVLYLKRWKLDIQIDLLKFVQHYSAASWSIRWDDVFCGIVASRSKAQLAMPCWSKRRGWFQDYVVWWEDEQWCRAALWSSARLEPTEVSGILPRWNAFYSSYLLV